MADNIRFEIVTPTGAAYSSSGTSVVIPSKEGELEILPGHRALLALVGHGTVVVTKPDNSKAFFVVEPGYVEVADNVVTLLVAGCTASADVDLAAARLDFDQANQAISAASHESIEEERERAARARARIDMLERATGQKQA